MRENVMSVLIIALEASQRSVGLQALKLLIDGALEHQDATPQYASSGNSAETYESAGESGDFRVAPLLERLNRSDRAFRRGMSGAVASIRMASRDRGERSYQRFRRQDPPYFMVQPDGGTPGPRLAFARRDDRRDVSRATAGRPEKDRRHFSVVAQ
jgi:hypothetical protein